MRRQKKKRLVREAEPYKGSFEASCASENPTTADAVPLPLQGRQETRHGREAVPYKLNALCIMHYEFLNSPLSSPIA